MLRIWRAKGKRKADVRVDYADAYLNLTSLLVDAATLEHSLLATYLYALFSIKDRYAPVRGELTTASFHPQPPDANPRGARPTFLDVTIEEMQHLALVNQLLYELYSAPCLERHTFPHRFEIYPFRLELRPLDRYTAATFTWIEAAASELNPETATEGPAPRGFIRELERVINKGSKGNVVRAFKQHKLEHLGSLYAKILERLDRLRDDPPAFLPETFPWGVWADRIDWIRNQGEIEHYRFFRSLFTGEAFGSDASIWSDPRASRYPARDLPWRTAFGSRENVIPKRMRPLAWLSNLIYWILLCLLDVSYRSNNRKLIYVAIEQMSAALWWLGLELARNRVGMPFDVMLVRYNLGRDDAASLAIIRRLIEEARLKAELIDAQKLLPPEFDLGLFDRTLRALNLPGDSS
jgi:rubrerythrin